jgi:Flp pilus assembly protein CpaB
MKRLSLIVLSLLLLYSGVAQALAACRAQNHHGQFVSAEAQSHHTDTHDQSHPTAKWHCASCDLHVGSALPRMRPVLLEEDQIDWIDSVALPRSTHLTSQLRITWPNRSPSISVPVNSSRFLAFISVFRI